MYSKSDQLLSDVYEDLKNDSGYRRYEREIAKLGREIKEALGAKQDAFFRYESLIYLTEGLSIESASRITERNLCQPDCQPKKLQAF